MPNFVKAALFALAFAPQVMAANPAWVQTALHRFEAEFGLSCSMIASGEYCEGDHPFQIDFATDRGACYYNVTYGCALNGIEQVKITVSSLKSRFDRDAKLHTVRLSGMKNILTLPRKIDDTLPTSDTLGTMWVVAWLEAQGTTIKRGTNTKWRRGVRLLGEFQCKRQLTFEFASATLVATERGTCPEKNERGGFSHAGFIEKLEILEN